MDSTEILETSLQNKKEIRTIPIIDCVGELVWYNSSAGVMLLLINLWSFTTKDAVIGVSLHGNLDVSLHNCQVLRCSAAGLVIHFEMIFGKKKEIRKTALFYLVTLLYAPEI